MNGKALCFEEVDVRRMYGDDHDGLSVRELCPGINIIFGPNGAGKTTLAHSLQCILWPSELDDGASHVEAHFKLDGSKWNVEIDAGRVRCQCDGSEQQLPLVTPAERHQRYRLHLHELLRASNSSFAEAIQKEAAGGFDVGMAAEQRGFKEVRLRKGKATEAVSKARESVREAQNKERALRRDQDRVAALERELASAEEAEKRAQLLEQVLECVRVHQEVDRKEHVLDAFPDAMDEVRGEEVSELGELKERRVKAESDLEEAREAIAAAEEAIAGNRISAEGLSDELIARLQKQLQKLEQTEAAAGEARRELERAREEEEREWERIKDGTDRSGASSIDIGGVQVLVDLAREGAGIRAKKKALGELMQIISPVKGADQSDKLKEAIQHLRRWLGAHSRESRLEGLRAVYRWIVVCTVLAAVAGAALGVWVHPVGFALLAIAALLGFVLFQFKKEREANGTAFYEDEFKRLGFEEPETWDAPSVQQREEELSRRWDERRLNVLKAGEYDRLAGQEKKVVERLAEVEEKRQALAERVGAAPNTDEEVLTWLVDRLGRWQSALTKAAGLEKKLEAVEAEEQRCLDELSEELAPFGFEAVTGRADAAGQIEALREDERRFSEAKAALAQAQKDEKRAEGALGEARREIRALYERLGLKEGEEAKISELVGMHDDFKEAEAAFQEARQRAEILREELEKLPDFEGELIQAAEEDLEKELGQAQEAAAEKEALKKKVHQIEQRVEDAKRKHDVEEKKAVYRQRREALRRERREDYQRLAGWMLAEHVHEQTRDQELPKVFHRARDLFQDITRHRYRLDFDSRDASFRAYDMKKERGLALDELSSGTRIQLLLAVRVAFVEELEQGYKLPLILDETLAISDSTRAQAIIEAIWRISEKGRQVFYFTAQDDEVAKWKRLLDGRGGHFFRLIPIANSSGSTVIKEDGLSSLQLVSESLPDPDECTHAEYGDSLGVPPWSLRSPMGEVHLWYLTEDSRSLHRALGAGIKYWGQLSAFSPQEARSSMRMASTTFRRIAARAAALEAWKKAWLIGRGKPVDRAALRDSGAVTEAFIDRVYAVCEEVNGEAEAMLDRLREGAVKGLHAANIEKLEAYFADEGHVEPLPALSREAIRARVLREVSSAFQEGYLTHDALDRLIQRVQRRTQSERTRS